MRSLIFDLFLLEQAQAQAHIPVNEAILKLEKGACGYYAFDVAEGDKQLPETETSSTIRAYGNGASTIYLDVSLVGNQRTFTIVNDSSSQLVIKASDDGQTVTVPSASVKKIVRMNDDIVEIVSLDYIKEGDDRLADARMPLAHAQTHVDGTDDIQLATSSQKGLMSSAYAVKLDEAVTGPASSTNGGVAIFDGTDGKVLKDGGHVIYATTDASNVYERGAALSIKGSSTAADRYTWVSPSGGLVVGINGTVYKLATQVELDLSSSTSWDSTSPDYTIAANRKGKDFYVYACEPASGNVPVLLLSASSTYPDGYTADTSRKIGGFHCLCLSVGTISGHPLSGFVTGDILPLSVWDLLHRPKTASPEGMVWCPSANIWVDIYLQSGTGSTTASAYGATITDTRTWMDHVDDLAAVNKRLLDDGEFQKVAAGGNEETNIAGSADPGTTGGHTDTAGRRMISAIGCEDCAGAMYQWLSDQSFRSDYTTSWGWYDLPGGKGSLYNQAGTRGRGDVKLRAGGLWDGGADCGSRCRRAGGSRWDTYSHCGARGAAEPV